MRLLESRYSKLREKYIFPLVPYTIKYNKLDYNNLKIILVNSLKDFKRLSDSSYALYFDKEDLFKGLIGDIEYFYTRALVQFANLKASANSLSACWHSVTQYYFSYFSATVLLRLLFRGNLYLDKSHTDKISDLGSLLSKEKVLLSEGNYIFKIVQDSYANDEDGKIVYLDDYYIELNYAAKRGTHEQTWLSIGEFINENINLDATKNDEYTVLQIIKSICTSYTPKFPSALRNKVNYQSPYGYLSMHNILKCTSIEDEQNLFLRELLQFDGSKDENYMLKMSNLYGMYFFMLATNLYIEYCERSTFDKKYTKDKLDYFRRLNIEMPKFFDFNL